MSFPTGCREVVYQLRAQGMTFRDIAQALPERFPNASTPDFRTIHGWLTDPEASALVRQAETRIRATVAHAAADLVPETFAGIKTALADGDYRAVDAYSRAVVNMTRGFIQERLEVTAGAADAPDELATLLTRHGVQLEQRVTPPALPPPAR